MKIVFLPEAVEDIQRRYEFLVVKNPLAAAKAMLAIDEGLERLQQGPYVGVRMHERPEYRQLFTPFGKSAYVLRYRIHEETGTLVVVRVWHGREARD